MQFLDDHTGQVFRYVSTLRPIASIGYDRIPHILIEPGTDPSGTRRDFSTSLPLPASIINRFDLEFQGVAHQVA